MTTRATIIARAFGRLGRGDYEFDVEPGERAAARASLDAMMDEWAAEGVNLGYTPSDNDNDAVAMTTPSWSDQAIWSNLALRIAPDFGKTPSGSLIRDARRGYSLAVSKAMTIPRASQGRSTIHGGGQRWYRRWGW